MIRSFLRWWRYPKPRPTLWQWIRGYRGSLWFNGKHVGFTKNFKMTVNVPHTPAKQSHPISFVVDELADMPIEAFMGIDPAAKDDDSTVAMMRHYPDGKVARIYHPAPDGHFWCPDCLKIHKEDDPSDRCKKHDSDTDF